MTQINNDLKLVQLKAKFTKAGIKYPGTQIERLIPETIIGVNIHHWLVSARNYWNMRSKKHDEYYAVFEKAYELAQQDLESIKQQ